MTGDAMVDEMNEIGNEREASMTVVVEAEKMSEMRDEKVTEDLKLDGGNAMLHLSESFLEFVDDCSCEKQIVSRREGENKNDCEVLNCVEHTTEAVGKESDLVKVNENRVMVHVAGGGHQICVYTKPCDDRLGRRDTGMCTCECWCMVGDNGNTSCDV